MIEKEKDRYRPPAEGPGAARRGAWGRPNREGHRRPPPPPWGPGGGGGEGEGGATTAWATSLLLRRPLICT